MRTLALILLGVLAGLLAVHITLVTVDPLGVIAYGRALQWVRADTLPHPTGYRHPTGVHATPFGRVTILPDGTRWTGSAPNGCRLLIVGDSVAFGMGVGDTDTFAAHLARLRPDWHVINTARVGYNSGNLARAAQAAEADTVLYLMVNNDAAPPVGVWTPIALPSPIRLYGQFFQPRVELPTDSDAFRDMLAVMSGVDAHVVAFGGNPLIVPARDVVDVTVIPPHNAPISAADPHPSPEGHRRIANALLDVVECVS